SPLIGIEKTHWFNTDSAISNMTYVKISPEISRRRISRKPRLSLVILACTVKIALPLTVLMG
ncbi:MAG: hypothetical protein ACP8RL_06585, partial [cyanobacterium endosymbiont of Rhopalodia inflata]